MEENTFGVYDYIVFISTVGISAFIGLYFGIYKSKNNTAHKYLYGNKNLRVLPVGLSLFSSALSTLTFIGQPSEVYVFGAQFAVGSLGILLSVIITWNVVLPVFCGNLTMCSPLEYFERRFNPCVRILASLIFILGTLVNMPVIIYVTVLTINKTTGFPMYTCAIIVQSICILYTMLGGIRSVVWTDTFQTMLMVTSFFTITILGMKQFDSWSEIWNLAEKGGRTQMFNMDPNPFLRTTFWTTFFGIGIHLGSHCASSASALQRYMSLKNENEARVSSVIGVSGYAFTSLLSAALGLSMYAYYAGCDPVKAGIVKNANDLVPYFIKEIMGNIPGLIGFITSGIICASLSSISSDLNITAALIYYDITLKLSPMKFKKSYDVSIMRAIVVLLGIFSVAVIPVLENTRYIMQLVISLTSFTYGARFGLLMLGILFPMANSTGALTGSFACIVIILWISLGAQFYDINAKFALPTSVEKCSNFTLSNITAATNLVTEKTDTLKIYDLSFCYYTLFGSLIVIFVGVLVSYLTGKNNKVDQMLIAPFLRTKIEETNDYDDNSTICFEDKKTELLTIKNSAAV